MKTSPIQKALELPNGARFVRFALQVNPPGYAEQYRGEQPTLSKEEYNRALAERCEAPIILIGFRALVSN